MAKMSQAQALVLHVSICRTRAIGWGVRKGRALSRHHWVRAHGLGQCQGVMPTRTSKLVAIRRTAGQARSAPPKVLYFFLARHCRESGPLTKGDNRRCQC